MLFVLLFLFRFVILTSLSRHIRMALGAEPVFEHEAGRGGRLQLQYNRHIITALYILLRYFVLTGWMLTARKSPPLPDRCILLPFTHPGGNRWHFHR